MSNLLLAVLLLPSADRGPLLPDDVTVRSLFVKAGPNPNVPGRSPRQDRAVVLIHGLGLHFFHTDKAAVPRVRHWQQPDSPMVRRLAQNADVYAFAYGQNVAVERFCTVSLLPRHILGLKQEGYREIILVGFSAGGVIARHLVEDHPEIGVTRVIQVCSPNAGTTLAALKTIRGVQAPFLTSLTRGERMRILEERQAKRIPERVQFACVVGSYGVNTDGVVPARSQWSTDLQLQGIPAYALRLLHNEAMTSPKSVELIARLVGEPQPRWDSKKVVEVRRAVLGK